MRRLSLPLIVVVSLVLAACAGGGPAASAGASGSANPTASANPGGGEGTEQDLEAAARASFLAFLGSDNEAYFNLLSRACREEAGFAVVENKLTQRRSAARAAGIDLAAISIATVEIDGFTGSSADVALVLQGTTEQFRETVAHAWVHEADGWRWTDCADFRTGGGGGPGTSSRDDPIDYGIPAEINGWFVVVSYVTLDATDLIVGEGIEAPAPGHQYVDIQVLADYDGADPSTTMGSDLAFSLVSDGATYDEPGACAAIVWYLALDEEVGPGGSIRGSVCASVPTDEVSSLVLLVEDLASGTEWWFGLQ